MNYRFLGKTGIKVSSLCLGTMTFGVEADEHESRALFMMAREAGINFFDCADFYGKGRSEEILGRLIKDCRQEVVITSKFYFQVSPDINAMGASRRHIINSIEGSLRRLSTDRIDIYFIHRFDDKTPLEETLRALDDLVRQGNIVYIGASNFAAWQVEKALGVAARNGLTPVHVIQPMYNLAKRMAEVEIFPMAQAENLGVMTYSPLGGGLFSGKYGLNRKPEVGRLVSNKLYQTRYGDEKNYEIAEKFIILAREKGFVPPALAVAWAMSHPAVTSAIIGARNTEQLKTLLSALEISMTDELRSEISAISPEPPPATDRSEERTPFNLGVR